MQIRHLTILVVRLAFFVLLSFFALLSFFNAGALLVAQRQAINAQRPRGLIEDRTKWPKYLLETIEPLDRNGFIPKNVEGFRTHVRSNDRFALRFSRSECSPDQIVSVMLLTKVDADHGGVGQFHRWMPDEWKINLDRPTTKFYVSPGWLNGDEGDKYVFRTDSSDEFAYIYYYYNF